MNAATTPSTRMLSTHAALCRKAWLARTYSNRARVPSTWAAYPTAPVPPSDAAKSGGSTAAAAA